MTMNLDEKKSQRNMPSSFDWSHMYCHLQLRSDFFGEQCEQVMCCHMSQFLKIRNILKLSKTFNFYVWMV